MGSEGSRLEIDLHPPRLLGDLVPTSGKERVCTGDVTADHRLDLPRRDQLTPSLLGAGDERASDALPAMLRRDAVRCGDEHLVVRDRPQVRVAESGTVLPDREPGITLRVEPILAPFEAQVDQHALGRLGLAEVVLVAGGEQLGDRLEIALGRCSQREGCTAHPTNLSAQQSSWKTQVQAGFRLLQGGLITLVCSRWMEGERPNFQPAGAGAVLISGVGASVGAGALVGWAAGSVGYGVLGGAAVGVPVGVYAVYRRYRGAFL